MKFIGFRFKSYEWFNNRYESINDYTCRPFYFLTEILNGIKSECRNYPSNLLANILMIPISVCILIGIIFMLIMDLAVMPFKFLWSVEFKTWTLKRKLKKKTFI